MPGGGALEALQKLIGSVGSSEIRAFMRCLDDADPEVRKSSLEFVRDQEGTGGVHPVFEWGLTSTDARGVGGEFPEVEP